jgi:hypothetical protein
MPPPPQAMTRNSSSRSLFISLFSTMATGLGGSLPLKSKALWAWWGF